MRRGDPSRTVGSARSGFSADDAVTVTDLISYLARELSAMTFLKRHTLEVTLNVSVDAASNEGNGNGTVGMQAAAEILVWSSRHKVSSASVHRTVRMTIERCTVSRVDID